MTDANEIRRLQAAITRITNRVCMSTDPDYLRRRLADLEVRKAAGENVRHRASSQEPNGILTVSMPESMRLVAVEMGNRLKCGTSAMVRHAIEHFAIHKGWDDLVDKIEASASTVQTTSKGKDQ